MRVYKSEKEREGKIGIIKTRKKAIRHLLPH